MRIDAHQHFWQFDPVRDSWITDEMAVIQKDFLPEHLQPVLQKNGFDGCVLVQTDQSEVGNHFMLQLADENSFIKGIVGWIDLQAENKEERLAYYKQFNSIKGFRHVLQGEQDRALMLRPAFMQGITALQKFDFTYDILIFPDQLKYASELVASFPDQKFVLDHIAKPYIKEKKLDGWREDIIALAQYRNVYCKISGMVTEANWKSWTKDDFVPYLDVVVNAFGINRIMYGSDWPVCLVAASYEEVLGIVQDYFSSFSKEEQQLFYGDNAKMFYNLAE